VDYHPLQNKDLFKYVVSHHWWLIGFDEWCILARLVSIALPIAAAAAAAAAAVCSCYCIV
jgi:hypothetical protein